MARRGNVNGTGKQGIVDRRSAGQLSPVDLDVDALLLAVFLDEVGEMSPYLQAKLLRFLSDGCFRRIGGEREVRVLSRC